MCETTVTQVVRKYLVRFGRPPSLGRVVSDSLGDGLKVIRVHASWVTAQMVKDKTIWYRANKHLPRLSMGAHHPTRRITL